MNEERFNLITKYAIVLSVFYLLSFVFNRVVREITFDNSEIYNAVYQQWLPFTFDLILNIIAAFLVGQDVIKHKVKSKYLTLATIIYRPIGVFAFLLFLFIQVKDQE